MLIYAEKNNCTDCKFLIDFKKKMVDPSWAKQ